MHVKYVIYKKKMRNKRKTWFTIQKQKYSIGIKYYKKTTDL